MLRNWSSVKRLAESVLLKTLPDTLKLPAVHRLKGSQHSLAINKNTKKNVYVLQHFLEV